MKIAAIKAAYNHAPTMQLLLPCLFALVDDQQVHQYLICTLLWKIYHKEYLFRVSVLTTLPLQVSNFFCKCKHENPYCKTKKEVFGQHFKCACPTSSYYKFLKAVR